MARLEAATTVIEALRELSSFDLDELREKVYERIDTDASNACVYYSESQDIIAEYEAKYGGDDADVDGEWSAQDWRDAMQAYAIGIAKNALNDMVSDELTHISEAYDEMVEEVERLGGDADAIKIANECSYGWAVHNYETSEGVMVWSDERDHPNGCFNPELLEGDLVAVSHEASGGMYFNWCASKDSLEN